MPSIPSDTRSNRYHLNRAMVVDENFVAYVQSCTSHDERPSNPALDKPIIHQSKLTGQDLIDLFESQATSRLIDIVARQMRAQGVGYYTIGSSGHEGNALIGQLTRYTDMAFLHYRSGALMCERARQLPSYDFIYNTMLGIAASREDPVAGGRHKAWGSRELNVPPQTSTIASHLPKAVGTAMSIARAQRLQSGKTPEDMIVVCNFGDASANHATSQTAFNAAASAAYQRLPVPILFVCEDNGVGISVATPPTWIESQFRHRYGLTYYQANGLDVVEAYATVRQAVDHCRGKRRPVFLHLKTVRLLGHAGTDPETEYHSWQTIEANEAKDPLLRTAQHVMELGLLTPTETLDRYESIRNRIVNAASDAAKTPKLRDKQDIISTLAPLSPDQVHAEATRCPNHQARVEIFGGDHRLPELRPPKHMAALINLGLHDLLIKYPQAIIFGEDVAKKGGVYFVTNGLTNKFGVGRVFNTILDETTILGLSIGAAHVGLLPIPEIQYLAYYHNAQDQIRGEAASLNFFSNNQFRNPMVVRIAGWAYQKGFGGHFHNDNSITALRDVPGLIMATPSRGDDAVNMMRTCMSLAATDGRVIAFIEPIAMYMKKDLYQEKDHKWIFPYPEPGEAIPLGAGKIYHETAGDLTILTFANGTHMSLRAAKILRETHNINARVVDLRWLCPLNETFIMEQSLATGNVLVVDEGRRSGGVAEAILALLMESCGTKVHARRMNAVDTFIPLGPAADYVLPAMPDIVTAAVDLMKSST